MTVVAGWCLGAQATQVTFDGVVKTVDFNAPADIYRMINGATLNLNGFALQGTIAETGSTLNLGTGASLVSAGAQVRSGSTIVAQGAQIINTGASVYTPGLALEDGSIGTVTDSRIESTVGTGVDVLNSQVSLTNSQVSGQMGMRVLGDAVAQLVNTTVTATGGQSNPILDTALFFTSGGSARVSQGSELVGIDSGVLVLNSPSASTLVLDNSSVSATAGSGVQVGGLGLAGNANVLLQNNAVVSGSNGVAFNVVDASTLNLAVSDSTLEGGISGANASTLTATLDQSTVNGTISLASGSTLALQASGSQLTGDVNATGDSTLALDLTGSVLTGNVSTDGTGTTTVAMSGSQLTGNVSGVDSLALSNGSVLKGDVSGGGVATTVQLDSSQLTGDVSSVASVALNNGSALTGSVSGDGVATTVQLDRSQLTGNVSAVNSLALSNGSVMTGDVSGGGVATAVQLDRSQLNGSVSGVASLALNNGSALTGSVSGDGVATTVQLNRSHLTGNVSGVDSLALSNGSVMTGDVSGGGVATTVGLDGSQLTGNVNSVANLTLGNGSVLTGDVSGSDAMATTVQLSDSQLNGNLLDIASLGLTNSVLNGDVRAEGTSTAAQLTQSSWTGNATASDGATLNISLAQSTLKGDISADASSQANLVMTGQSLLTGTLSNLSSVSLADSTWQVTGDSSVTAMTLNDSTVALGEAGQFYRLSLGSLSGSGTFNLNVDFAQELASFVDVSGIASGDYRLLVSASGEDPAADNALQVVHTGAGSTAQFSLEGGPVDVGTYSYDLVQRGTDWFLDTDTKTISPEASTVLALFNTAPTVWNSELFTLRSRMGELRSNGAQPGFWMRAYGNKYNVSTSDVSYRQTQHGVSFGADAPVPFGDGHWLVGVLGGYSDSNLDLNRGTSGSVNSYYLGTYLTWLDPDSGYYFDGVLKFNRFQNSANVSMSDGTRSKGDYDDSAVGTSLEFGRHIALKDGYFIEPYTQLAGVVISGKDYSLDNGMQADGDTTHSLLGKVGTTLGRTIDLGAGSMVQPYVRAAFAHEFANNNRVQINGNSFNNDLSGSRGELGTGVALSLNERLQLHVDLDYSNGKHIEQPWGANVGLRYSW